MVRVDIINHSKSRTRRYTFLDADGITYEWFSGNRLDRLFPQIRVGDIDIPMVIDGTIVAVTGYTAFKSYHLERVVVP